MINKEIATPSNVITMLRILLVPVFVAALLCPWPQWMGMDFVSEDLKRIVAAAIFIIISCTDWLDGYLARSRNEVTDFGKFMDPLADKILVAAALISLVELGALPTWVVLIILAREFIVSGVRMIAATNGQVIAASYIGKAKTVFQMIAIIMFTIKDCTFFSESHVEPSNPMWVASWFFMTIALILTLISMLDYLSKARDLIGLGTGKSKKDECAEEQADSLEQRLVETAIEKGKTLATCESLTGGMIAERITSVSGSSACLKGSYVTYAAEAKNNLAGVSNEIIENDGVVSEACAKAMAQGARDGIGVDIAVSVTGIAGPTGAEPGKPVGTVWMGIASEKGVSAREFHFKGDREAVRAQTAEAALSALLDELRAQ